MNLKILLAESMKSGHTSSILLSLADALTEVKRGYSYSNKYYGQELDKIENIFDKTRIKIIEAMSIFNKLESEFERSDKTNVG